MICVPAVKRQPERSAAKRGAEARAGEDGADDHPLNEGAANFASLWGVRPGTVSPRQRRITPSPQNGANRSGRKACVPHALSRSLYALFAVYLAASPGAAGKAPAAKPFETFAGCVMEPDDWTDGDSFRVRMPDGRLETFRLYFVDTTESRVHSTRSDEQAAYFGITRQAAVDLGAAAKMFTARALQRPFTIQTRWRPVFGPTRYYAMVTTSDGEDLASLLVASGFARIYGTRTPLPDGRDSRTYLARLAELEGRAKVNGIGGWKR